MVQLTDKVRASGANVQPGVSIALAASSTTDGMDITIDVFPPRVTAVTWWISEDAQGEGLTADSYSGDVTTGIGTELIEHTAKKCYTGLTNESGRLVATAVASANPTDQYVAAADPVSGQVIVSGPSGTNWEGA